MTGQTPAATDCDACRGEDGFTLVELLVALSLLSLVIVALFATLRLGTLAWSRSAVHTDRVEYIAAVQGLLRRLIADAYPLFLPEVGNRGHVAFDGTTQSLKFLASSPIALGGAGRSWFTIFEEPNGERVNLVMRSTPELAAQARRSVSGRTLLAAKIGQLRFAYFGATRSDKVAQWQEQWKGEGSVPELVRMRIDFPAGDGRIWPELTIRTRITADVGCLYDQLTKRCRGR